MLWLFPLPLADDAQPEVRRVWHLCQAEPFERDIGPAWVVEEPDAVTEQDGGDADQDIIEFPGVEALTGNVCAEDVDVLVASGHVRRREAAGEITDEGNIRHRYIGGWWVSTNCGPLHGPPNALPSLSVSLYGSSPPKVRLPTRAMHRSCR